MRLSIRIDSRDFIVLNAETTSVSRALVILRLRRFAWAILQTEQALFLFSSEEVRSRLLKAKPSSLIVTALALSSQRPSVIVSRRNSTLTIEELPASGTPARRAIVARKDAAGELHVLAVGDLRKSTRRKAKVQAVVDEPRVPEFEERFTKLRAPIKGSSARGALAEKDAKKSGRFRISAHKRLGFGFDKPAPPPQSEKKTERVIDYETVDLFYATDRKQKVESPQGDGIVRFLNQLPDQAELRYGICSVTVPHNHKLGKIETPSIWTLKIRNRSKHFTISACSPRTRTLFFSQLQDRIGRSGSQSCFVFIHGYNVGFEDAAMRTAQLTKDLKFPGVPILYSWASAHKLSGYSQDEDTVSLTVKRLTAFLKQLTESSGAKEIHLIAHSMGNRALINAIERLNQPASTDTKLFRQVVLTAPDVPRKDVESLIEAASLKAERVTLYASRKDKALGISKIKHKYERLGKVYGFPYVLAGMDSIDASDVRTDFVAHTTFAKTRSVLGDLQALIAHGEPPDHRFGLIRLISPAGVCWKFSL